MKKTILGLAFLTLASFSFTAAAQNKTDRQCKSGTECVSKDKCKKEGKKDCKRGDFKKGRKQAKVNPFEGLNLTTEQQGRIEALNSALKVSRKELKQQAKTARENRDTTFNPRKANKELRSKYVNDLGEILTTDQMTVFLKNYYINHGGNDKAKMAKRPGKDDRKGVRF